MKQARLKFLLLAATGLVAVRWWLPPGEGGEAQVVDVVTAIDRPSPERIGAATVPVAAAVVEVDVPGNAFSVRVPPMPPVPPPPPAPPKEKLFVGPPVPPPYVPPPPPPIQVVGTWDDGKLPGVFISSPQSGTVLARVGTVLMVDYKVTALTPQYVALTHTSSKHEWRLPIPRAANP